METPNWLTLGDVYNAYVDCCRRKRSSKAYVEFAQNECENIYSLWQDLNNGEYEIGESIAFCVTKPKIREVFAANFRDRIVHHLLMLKYGDIIEKSFINNTYNCRKGKGNIYGIKQLHNTMLKYPEYWTVKMDMKGFFYSIDKQLLYDKLEKFLRDNYKGNDLEELLKLTYKVVMHKPQCKCEKRGNKKLWNLLPKDRSLFTCCEGKGMAIGNLTSQIYANFYLNEFDWEMYRKYGEKYGRYVDDITVVVPHDEVKNVIKFVRDYLFNKLHIKLNPNKISIQRVRSGITFVGYGIKGKRLYTGKRTIYNAFRMVETYNQIIKNNNGNRIKSWIEFFIQRMNSYMGFMHHTKSFKFRKKLFNMVDDRIKKYLYMKKYKKVVVIPKYRKINKLKRKYYVKKNF